MDFERFSSGGSGNSGGTPERRGPVRKAASVFLRAVRIVRAVRRMEGGTEDYFAALLFSLADWAFCWLSLFAAPFVLLYFALGPHRSAGEIVFSVLAGAGWLVTAYAGGRLLFLVLAACGVIWEEAVLRRRSIRMVTLRELVRRELDFEKGCS